MGDQSHSDSACGLAIRALAKEPALRSHLVGDPTVRIIVLNAEMSTAKCRSAREQYHRIVKDRQLCPLIKSLETPWTICDLEDVVQDRAGRRRWPELEVIRLRDKRGIYGEPGDDLHFRRDIARAAGDELIKAVWRTARCRHSPDFGDGDVLLVLAAGWNANGAYYNALDENGHAWRKAELVALAELCALNGHLMSTIRARMQDLLVRASQEHIPFLLQSVDEIRAVEPPSNVVCERRTDCESATALGPIGHLEGWLRSSRTRRRPDEQYEGFRPHKRSCREVSRSLGSIAIDLTEEDDCQASRAHAVDPGVQQLVEMGFSRAQSCAVLGTSAGDVSRAVEIMLGF